ncbi:hypothetical protein LQW54_001071 [Pestalotiopsis sp. IQ-011]
MSPINTIVARDAGDSENVMNLMITFLGLAFVALILAAILIMMRRKRLQKQRMKDEGLPQYNDIQHECKLPDGSRRLTITTADGRSSVVVLNNNRPMLADPNAPPYSPKNIPEIHITFPDEHDDQGRKQDGRVMVVRVGETTVGMEPVREEQLPAYEKESSHGFYSIDMDQIGGLKEKDRSQFQ